MQLHDDLLYLLLLTFYTVQVLDPIFSSIKYMFFFLVNWIELWSESILQMWKLYVFICFIHSRSWNFFRFFLIYYLTLWMSWKRISSLFVDILQKLTFSIIFSWRGNILLARQLDLISITKRRGAISESRSLIIIKLLFATCINRQINTESEGF